MQISLLENDNRDERHMYCVGVGGKQQVYLLQWRLRDEWQNTAQRTLKRKERKETNKEREMGKDSESNLLNRKYEYSESQ